MASIPTTSELYTGIKQSLEAELGVKISLFGKSFLNAIAMVQAAKLKLYWLAIGLVQKNIFVDTADSVANGGTLERFGLVKLNRLPFPPTQAVYNVDVTGVNGAVIPIGTIYLSDDSALSPQKKFILDIEHTMVGTTGTISIRALEAGIPSKLEVPNTLTSISPLLNVDDLCTVSLETTIPTDGETTEDYRAAVVRAFQLEPQGGAATDYRIWSDDAVGVRAVYPYTKSGEGSVIDLFVEANVADSLDGKGTPTGAILTDVEAVVDLDPDTSKPINERGRRPLGIRQINFLPITPKDVTIVFNNPTNIDSGSQNAIIAALETEIDLIRPFIEAADIITNKNDILDVNRVISTAQELLTGSQTFDGITMTVDGNPVTTSIQFNSGDIPFLTSTTFV